MIIPVFIPIRTTEFVEQKVMRSLKAQTVKTVVHLEWSVPVSTHKRRGEFEARNRIREKAKQLDCKYAVGNDSDAQHLFADNLQCMQQFLDDRPEIGAVALWRNHQGFTYPEINHVCLACVMFRREALINVCELELDGPDINRCCCSRYANTIKGGIYFLDGLRRIRNLDR